MSLTEPVMTDWEGGEEREVPLATFGEGYRRYRLPDSAAEAAMARSLSRYRQMAPVVVCLREETPEIVDGFKRLAAARMLPRWTALRARRLVADERTAKAAIYGLNRTGRPTQELEEAWIVFALVREDGLTQVEAAELLGRHKSWICRRLALLERLDESARDELRLGLLGPTAARALVPLPAGNQIEVLACARREGLTTAELKGVAELVRGAQSRPQVDYVLEKPRQALAQSQAGPWRVSDPRLSMAGNRVSRQLATLLDQLSRMETWLAQRGRAELERGDGEILAAGFVRLGRDAQTVAELAGDLGQELRGQELSGA
jgi:ParB-like chromosome segregation protein Spo0J